MNKKTLSAMLEPLTSELQKHRYNFSDYHEQLETLNRSYHELTGDMMAWDYLPYIGNPEKRAKWIAKKQEIKACKEEIASIEQAIEGVDSRIDYAFHEFLYSNDKFYRLMYDCVQCADNCVFTISLHPLAPEETVRSAEKKVRKLNEHLAEKVKKGRDSYFAKQTRT